MIKLLRNPLIIILSVILGVFFGLEFKTQALALEPVGQIYLSLIKMCIIPILVTAVVSSLGKLLKSAYVKNYIRRILSVFALFLLATSVIGLGVGLMAEPGSGLGEAAYSTLGKVLNESDVAAKSHFESTSVLAFMGSVIPENIFSSLNEGYMLQILFFAILIGIALGYEDSQTSIELIQLTDAMFRAFFLIIDWAMYLLPFGLFFLIAGQIASTGVEILIAMAKFILIINLTALFLILINAALLSYFTRISIFQGIWGLSQPMLIAFATRSTLASIPSAIEGLSKKLGVDSEVAHLVVPLGAIMNRFSMILMFSVGTIFAAQLYSISLDSVGLLMALMLSIVAAVAGAGTPGIVSIAMISVVLGPLGLPSEAMIILLLAINPMIEPILTSFNIHTNCVATAIIAAKSDAGREPVLQGSS